MSESRLADDTIRAGLLMEGIQAQQRMTELSVERLSAHMRGLDEVVRDEIRRTLVEEFRQLSEESRHVVQSLVKLRRAARSRTLLWTFIVASVCTIVPCLIAGWMLPSAKEVANLRAQRDALSLSVNRLHQLGGRIDLRQCGAERRLCVRVDRKGPGYGTQSDYFVVKEF